MMMPKSRKMLLGHTKVARLLADVIGTIFCIFYTRSIAFLQFSPFVLFAFANLFWTFGQTNNTEPHKSSALDSKVEANLNLGLSQNAAHPALNGKPK